MKKTISMVLSAWAFLAGISRLSAGGKDYTPLPGDGTTAQWCDVASVQDTDEEGKTVSQSLRDRVEIYNQKDRCDFLIFFLYRNKEIVLKKPLVLENKPHDRNQGSGAPVLTGTYITGYGPGGEADPLGLVIDAREATEDSKDCAFVIKGGFQAKQQIHGFTLLVRRPGQAVCDENGTDLLEAVSPWCGGKKGKDCDFKDLVVLSQPESGEPPADTDSDDDGVTDAKDLCPGDPVTGGEVANYGCPNTKCVVFLPRLSLVAPAVFLSASRRIRNPGTGLRWIPVVKDKTGLDADGDGIDDACDWVDDTPKPCDGQDSDEDGVCDAEDLCDELGDDDSIPSTDRICGGELQCSQSLDQDEDGLGDACDEDIDGDGAANGSDVSPFDPDIAVFPVFDDADGDGLSDEAEGRLGTDPNEADSDRDGVSDPLDCLPRDPEKYDCIGLVTPPPMPPGGTPEPEAPSPAESEPENPAPQDCQLNLVAHPPGSGTGYMSFLGLLLPSAVLAGLRARKCGRAAGGGASFTFASHSCNNRMVHHESHEDPLD